MKDFKEILEKIAKENGTTPENVLQEMQRAIDEAYDHHDASAQPLWDRNSLVLLVVNGVMLKVITFLIKQLYMVSRSYSFQHIIIYNSP